MKKNSITVGIAEDHYLLRQGTINLLKQYKHISVLFDVSDGKELLENLKTVRPNVLLLDIEMPLMKGQEVVMKIRKKYPRMKIVILTMHFKKEFIIEFFKLGVNAFLPKAVNISKVAEVIEIVNEKGGYHDPDVAAILAEELYRGNYAVHKSTDTILSDSELKVLKLVCSGASTTDAAKELNVKPETISFHRRNIMRKTGAKNVAALVSYAIENKMFNPKG